MELSGHELKLHVPPPYRRGLPVWLDSYWRWETGPSFHAQGKEIIEAVGRKRWRSSQWKRSKKDRSEKFTSWRFGTTKAYCWKNTPQKVSQRWRKFTSTLFCAFGRQSKRNTFVNSSQGVILLHDNARPHKAPFITFLLNDFCWYMFGHPAHSPDLTLQSLSVCEPSLVARRATIFIRCRGESGAS